MASGTSDRACDRCRERRVKCDKRVPACLRCEKLNKPCPGYDKKRKFVDEGAVLRRKFQVIDQDAELPNQIPSPIGTQPSPSTSSGNPHSAPDLQFRPATQPFLPQSESPLKLESTLNNDPVQPTSFATFTTEPGTQLPPAADPEAILNDILDDPSINPAWFNIEPDEFYGANNNSCGFIPNIPNIVNEVDRSEFLQGSARESLDSGNALATLGDLDGTWAPKSQFTTSALITDEREHEMAYLIRHFTEAIGPWMDLFDRDKHFAQLAPLKALRDALLRNAIAAVAAKQLGRTRGSKTFLSKQSQKPATMEVLEEEVAVDWFYKAANYYDKAIAFSRIYIQALSGILSSPGTPGTQMTLSRANSDDLLVAVSIFSLYESLDNGDVGWLQHLSGLKSLFMAVTTDRRAHPQLRPSITVGRKASFWNFARADYQAAYINHQKTYLDTDDLPLWQSCGLQMRQDGSLYQDASAIQNELLGGHEIAELVSHTLLWIVLRVMNFLFGDPDLSAQPNDRHAEWTRLTGQLEQWHANLPATFQPCARIKHALQPRMPGQHSSAGLTEVFFSINVCAAAMQLYHFARILLLLNEPVQEEDFASPSSSLMASGSAGMNRLRAYRELSNEAIKHAHQIVGIALARPDPAVRVEMLLPLSVAGSCLEAEEERAVVLELLLAIEKDTGCSTESRVQELMKEWHWQPETATTGMIVT